MFNFWFMLGLKVNSYTEVYWSKFIGNKRIGNVMYSIKSQT